MDALSRVLEVEIGVSTKPPIKEEAMSKKDLSRAQRITVDEITTVAAAGVARALVARQAAAVDLSAEELAQVDGGFTLAKPPIYYGGPFFTVAAAQLVDPAAQLGNPAQLGIGLG